MTACYVGDGSLPSCSVGVGAAAVAVRVRRGDSSLVQLHKKKDFTGNSARVLVHSRRSGQTAGGHTITSVNL